MSTRQALKLCVIFFNFILFTSINGNENNPNKINKNILKNKFDIFFGSEYYEDVIYFIKEDSSEALDYLNRLKEVYSSYKNENDPFELRSYVSEYSNLVIWLNKYKAYKQCISIDLPDISIEKILKCDRPNKIFKKLNIEDNQKNGCYMFYVFRNLVGFGSHNKSYQKYKKKFKKDEYFNFLEELREKCGKENLKDMPYDSLEKVMKDINELNKDAYQKLIYVDHYYFSSIIHRFTLLYLFKKKNNENKIFSEVRFTEMLEFFSREPVINFWYRLLKNIDIWNNCNLIDVEYKKSFVISYIKLTEKWERIQKQKDTKQKDE